MGKDIFKKEEILKDMIIGKQKAREKLKAT